MIAAPPARIIGLVLGTAFLFAVFFFEQMLYTIVLLSLGSVLTIVVWYLFGLIVEMLEEDSIEGYDEIIYSLIIEMQDLKKRISELEQD